MFDTNLLFHSGSTYSTSTATPPWVDVGKTPADGVDIQISVTALSGSATGLTLDFTCEECDTTNGSAVTVATFPQMSGTGRQSRRVQSKKRYLRLPVTCGGATGLSCTITAGIVSGVPRDQTA